MQKPKVIKRIAFSLVIEDVLKTIKNAKMMLEIIKQHVKLLFNSIEKNVFLTQQDVNPIIKFVQKQQLKKNVN